MSFDVDDELMYDYVVVFVDVVHAIEAIDDELTIQVLSLVEQMDDSTIDHHAVWFVWMHLYLLRKKRKRRFDGFFSLFDYVSKDDNYAK